MEASGIVFRPLPCFSGAGIEAHSHSSSKASLSDLFVNGGNRSNCGDLRLLGSRVRKFSGFLKSGFCDNGHVQYYYGSTTPEIRCGSGKKDKVKEKEKGKSTRAKKMMKKRLKLLKGLSSDLSVFSEMGFGLDPYNHGLIDQVKGKIISEATEVLLGQLQQLRAEEEELKRKRKEEKAKLKAAAMQNRLDCEVSSGSSSESSDSECGEVVDMSRLNREALAPPVLNELQTVMQEATLTLPSTLTQEVKTTESQHIQEAILTIPSTMTQAGKTMERRDIECSSHHIEQECSTPTSTSNIGNGGSYDGGVRSVAQAPTAKKIEVCMGGKCKKSGSAALLEEFQRVLGAEGAAVGCKCMGKCRDGPNVRVSNYCDGVQAQGLDDSVRTPTNPLCIGVGFEDVGLIVANFFGETPKDMGLAAAS